MYIAVGQKECACWRFDRVLPPPPPGTAAHQVLRSDHGLQAGEQRLDLGAPQPEVDDELGGARGKETKGTVFRRNATIRVVEARGKTDRQYSCSALQYY
eukprot:SAG22_NODE_1376_length_4554_cov_11.791919_6_plen_99_part_00